MAQPNEVSHGHMHGKIFRLKIDKMGHHFTGVHGKEGPVMEDRPYKVGDKVKVVMVSRFGDCGITHDLNHPMGGMIYYETRVNPEDLEEACESTPSSMGANP